MVAKPEFMGVLEIHHLIAYIIGSLHKIYKRMTRIAQRSVGRRTSKHSQLVGHAAEVGSLRSEESEFVFIA